jgi:predicted permease
LIPFAATLAALAPVFLLILFGHLMKRGGFPGDGFWGPFALVLVASWSAVALALLLLGRWLTMDGPGFTSVVQGGIRLSAVALALLLLGRWLTMDGPGFTSVVQGGIRFNTYVGLAAAEALFGTAGLTLAAVVIAVLVPLVNVLCVGVLNRHGSAGMPGWGAVLRGLASNPLILACLLGILLNASAVGLPWGSGEVLDIIARAALPLGLLAVGAGLDARTIRDRHGAVVAVSAVKLVGLPLVAFAVAWSLGLPPAERAIAVLFAALPTAPSAYILARQMGGDAQLVAGMLTLQTIAAVLTLPLMLAWLA